MKKFKILLLSLISVFLCVVNVEAACDAEVIEELREWATKAEVLRTETTGVYADKYAYFLSVTPARDDIIVEVTTSHGNSATAKKFEDINLYAVGCPTNQEEETYTIKIYSKCSNELLKTLKHTVPRLNRMIKNEICDKYPDHELCQTFTNETKNMTEKEFIEKMNEYDESQQETSFLNQ